ncbi:hypothetical protein CVT25_014494 [Psilocybe cyanescens]|uniref:RlpA-like protein double-psi beta-barrel domain-containing protein n=1 Tax=Psilocybe cyanescens TaxID=93625 RepID=A0A409VP56_PSICY|nr:hypothetical protein CVT25_014494 [Psilocybe cyanescens]
MLTKILYASLLVMVTPTVSASYHGQPFNRHAELAKRADGDIQLFKRISGARWTYYDVEETGNPFELSSKHFQMNPAWCFKTITMTQGGKTTTATISDTCPGCPYGGLDLTEGLFGFFIGHWPEGGGVLTGDWEFTDAVPAKPVAPPPVITTKPAPKPAPVTTAVSSKHSSSSKISSSSISTSSKISSSTSASSTSITSSAAATTSIDYLSGAASGLAIPTGSIDRTGSTPSNLQDLNQFLIQIGGLAMAAGSL